MTSAPAGINCGLDCSEGFASGTVVVLTAQADPGSSFVGFTGNPDCYDGTVTMTFSFHCVASFVSRLLTVARMGNGTGTVISAPAGIDCGMDCSGVTGRAPWSCSPGSRPLARASPASAETRTATDGGHDDRAAALCRDLRLALVDDRDSRQRLRHRDELTGRSTAAGTAPRATATGPRWCSPRPLPLARPSRGSRQPGLH